MASSRHEETTLYQYDTLEHPGHIRIMLLQPASDTTAPIHFSFMQSSNLNLNGNYEAISYCWGEPNLTYPVYVENGQHLLVTKNLDGALRRLRRTSQSRWLWADAVCINQSDEEEKATQIPLMVHIFRGARKVLAWLGPGSDSLNKSMQRLGFLSRLSRDAVEAQIRNERVPPEQTSWVGVFDSILHLLSLPWFSRLWIVQEVIFNVDVILICGAFEQPWTRLTAVTSIMTKTPVWGLGTVERGKIDAIQKMAKLWRHHCFIDEAHTNLSQSGAQVSKSQDNDILELMEQFSNYGCSDPRDRVFALYSMTPHIMPVQLAELSGSRDAVMMDIDYSLDIRQTYQTLAVACMKSGRASALLSTVLSRRCTPVADDWPSWLPDWRNQPRKSELISTEVSGAYMCFLSQKRVSLSIPLVPGFSTSPSYWPIVDTIVSSQRLLTRAEYKKRLLSNLGKDPFSACINSVIHESDMDDSHSLPPTGDRSESGETKESQNYGYLFNLKLRSHHLPGIDCGLTDVPLRTGDHILPFFSSPGNSEYYSDATNALVLRPTADPDSFRLVGSAYFPLPLRNMQLLLQESRRTAELYLE